MQTASLVVEAERPRAFLVGPDTRVSKTLTLRQWCALMAAARLIAADLNNIALGASTSGRWMLWRRNQGYREQAAECAAELVRALHDLERQ
jgi:hypothetical protein